MAAWTYDPEERTYQTPRGRPLSTSQLRDIRNAIADFTGEQARLLARQYVNGALDLEAWALQFRALLEESVTSGFLLGRGGVNAVGLESLTQIDRLIRSQTNFAAQFARDIGMGFLSPEAMEARAATYAGAAVSAYEQARAAGAGLQLPTYPGDGSQDCRGNCRCTWVIEQDEEGGYAATWELDPGAEHCASCLDNADRYAPLELGVVSGAMVG